MKELVLGIVFAMLLVAGCAGSTPNNPPAANNPAPQAQQQQQAPPQTGVQASGSTPIISEFMVQTEASGDMKMQIILKDPASDSMTTASGDAELKIFSKSGDVVYQENFKIAAGDFNEGTRALTGAPVTYYFRPIPADKIKSSESSGNAEIKLTLASGKTISAKEDYVTLPVTVMLPAKELGLSIDAYSSKEKYTYEINLKDKNGAYVTADGKVTVAILDGQDVLYSKEFDVKAAGFSKDYAPAFKIDVPLSDVKKVFGSYKNGKTTVKFSSGDLSLSAEKEVTLPSYSTDDAQKMFDDAYAASAKQLNKKVSLGAFEVSILRAGFYNKSSYSDVETLYRIDMVVKNTGSKTDYSAITPTLMDSGGKQYDKSYSGTIDVYDNMQPGSVADGYLVFEKVPASASGLKLVLERSSYPDSQKETVQLG